MSLLQKLDEHLNIYPHLIWTPDPKLYNCSGRNYEEWAALGTRNPLQGSCTIIFGVIMISLYIITLASISDRSSLKHSCYQMMYFTSLYNIVNLFSSNVVSGYFIVVGAVFCTHPNSNYISGAIVIGGWSGMSIAVVSLALGRLAEVTGRYKQLFFGTAVFSWMILSLCVSFYFMFFTHPVIFNSTQGTWALIPYIKTNWNQEIGMFRNFTYLGILVAPPVVITTTYGVLLIYMLLMIKKKENTKFTKFQKKMFIQCLILSVTLSTTSYIYAAVYHLTVPRYIKAIAQVTYQTTESAEEAPFSRKPRTKKKQAEAE